MSGYELKGRHALVTGASSGIGKELSRCFAKEGAHWILSSHPSEKKNLLDLSGELERNYGIKTWSFTSDLTEEDGPKKLYDEVTLHVPVIDILVNDAGQMVYGDFHKTEIYRDLKTRLSIFFCRGFLQGKSPICYPNHVLKKRP